MSAPAEGVGGDTGGGEAGGGGGELKMSMRERLRLLKLKNQKAREEIEASRQANRTSSSDPDKENSVLSASTLTGRQNKTCPASGVDLSLSQLNNASLQHESVMHRGGVSMVSDRSVSSSGYGSNKSTMEVVRESMDERVLPRVEELEERAREREMKERGAQRRKKKSMTPLSPVLPVYAQEKKREETEKKEGEAGKEQPPRALARPVQRRRSLSASDKDKPSMPAPSSSTLLRSAISQSSLEKKRLIINGLAYTVFNVLGKGGSGTVYEVLDETHGRVVAVKEVSLLHAEPAVKEANLNEVELLRELQGSKHIITVYDYCLEDDVLYVVMEKGETDLQTFINNRASMKIDQTFIRYHWSEMLRCVKVIHDKKIVHSDLKPANFLLVRGNLKLIDFGIASAIPNNKTSVFKEAQMGTLSYMSPETMCMETMNESGAAGFKIPLKSDVWSLGCILYTLAYGKTPFQHYRGSLRMEAIRRGHIDFPPCDDPLLLETMKMCLVRNVADRADVDTLLEHAYVTGQTGGGQGGEGGVAAGGEVSTPVRNAEFDRMYEEIHSMTPNTAKQRFMQFTKRVMSAPRGAARASNPIAGATPAASRTVDKRDESGSGVRKLEF